MRARVLITTATVLSAAMLALPSAAGAATKVVYAGAPKSKILPIAAKLLGKQAATVVKTYSPAILAFSLQRVTINTGDSVKWVGLSTSGHTVDLPGRSGHDLAFLTDAGTASGVDDFAGDPFWFNGIRPNITVNPQLNSAIGGTKYNGTTRVDSGGNAPNAYTVTFTKPGVYKYFCDIHPGMVGYVVVRAKGTPIPSGKQDAAALTAQLTADVKTVKKLLKPKVPSDQVDLGVGGPGGVALYHFFPARLSVQAGTVVTFSVPAGERTEGHTAAFGPVSYLKALSNGSTAADFDETVYPSSNPAPGPIVVDSAAHGNGFANTGLVDRDPGSPFPATEKLKFTAPGTYRFYCLIHPFMTGTIVVH